jgi:hypothetical protein
MKYLSTTFQKGKLRAVVVSNEKGVIKGSLILNELY